MSRINLLKEVLKEVEDGSPDTVESVKVKLKNNGIERNMHVEEGQEFFKDNDKVIEWFLGQYLDIIESESWFAMNSLINKTHGWLQEKALR